MLNIYNAGLQSQIPVESFASAVDLTESAYNNNFLQKSKFIDLYGLFQKILMKHEIGNFDVVKDKKGYLHFMPMNPVDVSSYVKSMDDLKLYLDDRNIPLLYVQAPCKILDGYTEFTTGMYHNYYPDMEYSMVEGLKEKGIETLFLREEIYADHLNLSELYYRTDHHWKNRTAFWAFQKIIDTVNQRFGFHLDSNNYYRDLANYKTEKYDNCMFGSQGVRVGRYFTEIDDFELFKPHFSTEMELQLDNSSKKGSFEEVFIQNDEHIEVADYHSDYLGTNRSLKITNNQKNNGTIMIIKDSFALSVVPFLALNFKDTIVLDPRSKFEGMSIKESIAFFQPDIVVMLYNPSTIGSMLFDFDSK